MKNIKAEIYINRALLWLILAQVSLGNGVSKPLLVVSAVLVILNLIYAHMIEKESNDS